jgi:hypothetical protein
VQHWDIVSSPGKPVSSIQNPYEFAHTDHIIREANYIGLHDFCSQIFLINFLLDNRILNTHSWSWALLENPAIVQLLQNFPAFYGTRRFITMFTKALHWPLFWARSIQSIPSYLSKIHFNTANPPTSWSSQWSLTFWLFKYTICIPLRPFVLHALPISSFLTWSFWLYFENSYACLELYTARKKRWQAEEQMVCWHKWNQNRLIFVRIWINGKKVIKAAGWGWNLSTVHHLYSDEKTNVVSSWKKIFLHARTILVTQMSRYWTPIATAAARVQFQVRSYGICGGRNSTAAGLPLPILIPPNVPVSYPSSGSVQWPEYHKPLSHTTLRIKRRHHSDFINGEAETPAAQTVGNILTHSFYLLELKPPLRPEVKALRHYKRHYCDVTTAVIMAWSNLSTKDTHG